jgi:hypothetical protein
MVKIAFHGGVSNVWSGVMTIPEVGAVQCSAVLCSADRILDVSFSIAQDNRPPNMAACHLRSRN